MDILTAQKKESADCASVGPGHKDSVGYKRLIHRTLPVFNQNMANL
jgi:hypothetical protein